LFRRAAVVGKTAPVEQGAERGRPKSPQRVLGVVAASGGVRFGYLAVVDGLASDWAGMAAALAFAAAGTATIVWVIAVESKRRRFDDAIEPVLDHTKLVVPGKSGVVIRREPSPYGALVQFQVWIDGARAGIVASGETRLFEVEPGKHQVAVAGRRYRRPPPGDTWGVSLADGEVGDFVCSTDSSGVHLQPIESR
jgi:hypothetical protein